MVLIAHTKLHGNVLLSPHFTPHVLPHSQVMQGVTTSKALTELDPFLALELKLKQKDSNRNK